MQDHLKKCPKRILTCAKCDKFQGTRELLLQHIGQAHEQLIIDEFDRDRKSELEEEKKSGTMKGGQ